MKYDAKEFKKYPEIMNKEQMRVACHISKRTALCFSRDFSFSIIVQKRKFAENSLKAIDRANFVSIIQLDLL